MKGSYLKTKSNDKCNSEEEKKKHIKMHQIILMDLHLWSKIHFVPNEERKRDELQFSIEMSLLYWNWLLYIGNTQN